MILFENQKYNLIKINKVLHEPYILPLTSLQYILYFTYSINVEVFILFVFFLHRRSDNELL